jgi:hypothetical protein
MSSCFVLYCLTSSSSAFFRPSELVLRIGTTSLTVRSVNTPLIIRKHFRSPGKGSKVSKTSLHHVSVIHSVLYDEAVNIGLVKGEACRLTRQGGGVDAEETSKREKRNVKHTCVLLFLVRCHQSLRRLSVMCSCSSDMWFEALEICVSLHVLMIMRTPYLVVSSAAAGTPW